MSHTVGYLLRRTGLAVLFVLVAATVVFGIVHFGVANPADTTAATPEEQSALTEKKSEFGLDRPVTDQYVDYLVSMARFDFGETWADRDTAVAEGQQQTSVNAIVEGRVGRTAWLWGWTVLLGLPLTVGGVGLARYLDAGEVVGVVGRAVPAFLLAVVFETVLFNLDGLLLGLDWRTFLTPTPATITRPLPVESLGTTSDLLLATKLVVPPALALALPLSGAVAYLWQRGLADTATEPFVSAARAKGARGALVQLKHVLPVATAPILLVAGELAALLAGMTVLVEVVFSLEGLGSLLYVSVVRSDYTTLQAAAFLLVVFVAAVDLLGAVGHSLLGIGAERRRLGTWGGAAVPDGSGHHGTVTRKSERELRPRRRVDGILSQLRATPRPALFWVAGGTLLLLLQFGAVVDTVSAFVPGVGGLGPFPSLLDRGLVPNTGYRPPGGGWVGTFLGLSPAAAWLVRVGLVYAYAAAVAAWLRHGYRLFSATYRPTAWRPLNDVLARLRNHRGARFGGAALAVLLVAAVFAPTLGPTTADRTVMHSSLDGTDGGIDGSGTIRYLDPSTGTVETESVGVAVTRTRSTSLGSIGPGQYDEYGQFHPFGTTYYGTDLFTEMLFGLRGYLFVGALTVLVAGGLALLGGALALRFGPVVTRSVDGVADVVGLFPALPFLFLTLAWFHPVLTTLSTQFIVVGGLFGLVAWPRLWRTARPRLHAVRERAWVDAETAFGQPESRTVIRTLRPLLGVLLPYAVLAAAGAIAGTAGLSYLGHLSVGTPHGMFEWGGLLWRGQNFMLTSAGHTFVFPAAGLCCLLAAMHALAMGLREATTARLLGAPSSAGELGGLAD
jgi:peptide/nickel transport system permease protein